MDCSREWSEDDVYQTLATSLTAGMTSDVEGGFNTSDNELLVRLVGKKMDSDADFNSSDDELLCHYIEHLEDIDTADDPTYRPRDEEDSHRMKSGNRKKKSRKERDVVKALADSAALSNRLLQDRNVHKSRLETLLSANGLKRVDVPSDGNCFFHSCALLLSHAAADIRNCLCNYLEDNIDSFLDFMVSETEENQRYLQFIENVEELRQPGHWSNNAGDMLPLALAGWTRRTVRLSTSNPSRPILDVQPLGMVDTQVSDRAPILLALLEYQNAPHYNACFSIADKPGSRHSSCPHQAEQQGESVPGEPSMETDLQCSEGSQPCHRQQSPVPTLSCPQDSPSPLLHEVCDQQPTEHQQSPHSPGTAPLPETPRKQGTYKTPPKTVLTWKKTAHPESWKKNVRKALRLQGKEHLSDKGTVVSAKRPKYVDCSKCKLKCDRLNGRKEEIFQSFYDLGSYEKQKQFICAHIIQNQTRTLYDTEQNEILSKTRQVSRKFFLTVDGQQERVCKRFFVSTLAISHNYIHHAMENCPGGVFVGQEFQGRKQPHNKTPVEAAEGVKTHIRSFPTMPSHYTRKDTQREYLPSDLNIKKMHELYSEECLKEGKEPVTSRQYRKIFNKNFSLSFHVPKKDQYSTCTVYHNKEAEGSLTEAEEESYQQHLRRKERARKEKESDKEEAMRDPSKHVVTVDLQAVLQAPCGLVSQLYYKRKLSVYNFTVYSLGDGKGTCFIWDETEGKRGFSEIATCVLMYLRSLPRTVTDVTIYSDCYGGQNCNRNLTAALMYALKEVPNIQVINQKYLETGHTHMECDSMHAAISLAKKCTPVYVTSEWDIILRVARRGKRYTLAYVILRF